RLLLSLLNSCYFLLLTIPSSVSTYTLSLHDALPISSEAAAIHREILPKCQALFSAPSPTPVKAVLNMAGVPVGDVRLPLVPLSDEEHRELMRKMQLQITRVS